MKSKTPTQDATLFASPQCEVIRTSDSMPICTSGIDTVTIYDFTEDTETLSGLFS